MRLNRIRGVLRLYFVAEAARRSVAKISPKQRFPTALGLEAFCMSRRKRTPRHRAARHNIGNYFHIWRAAEQASHLAPLDDICGGMWLADSWVTGTVLGASLADIDS